MESFKLWIISICSAGIIASIFRIIVSNSSVKKTVNIFLSMFVFLYTVIPVEKVISDYNIISENYNNASSTDIYNNGYESIIKESINTICIKHDTSIEYMNIDSFIDDEGYFVVEEIKLKINDDSKKQVIQDEIEKNLNFEVTFI